VSTRGLGGPIGWRVLTQIPGGFERHESPLRRRRDASVTARNIRNF
jgi:hypothetical protein